MQAVPPDQNKTSETCGWCGDLIAGRSHAECIAPLLGMADVLEIGAIEDSVLADEGSVAASRVRAAAERLRPAPSPA